MPTYNIIKDNFKELYSLNKSVFFVNYTINPKQLICMSYTSISTFTYCPKQFGNMAQTAKGIIALTQKCSSLTACGYFSRHNM